MHFCLFKVVLFTIENFMYISATIKYDIISEPMSVCHVFFI